MREVSTTFVLTYLILDTFYFYYIVVRIIYIILCSLYELHEVEIIDFNLNTNVQLLFIEPQMRNGGGEGKCYTHVMSSAYNRCRYGLITGNAIVE